MILAVYYLAAITGIATQQGAYDMENITLTDQELRFALAQAFYAGVQAVFHYEATQDKDCLAFSSTHRTRTFGNILCPAIDDYDSPLAVKVA